MKTKEYEMTEMTPYRNDNLFLRANVRDGALVGLTISHYGGGSIYALRLQMAADESMWWVVEDGIVPSRTFFFRPAHDDGWDDSDLDELARAALKAIREDGKL